MRGYTAFLGKEIKENTRNVKFLILFIIFAIVGLLSPLTAKFLPVLLENLVEENITIILEDPTYRDSWIQFFSNTNQLSLVVLLLLFSPIMSKEYENGTFIHMVTKGLARTTIILTKATILFLSWTLGFWLSAGITLGYTHFYFSDSTTTGLFLPLVSAYSFGLLVLAVLLVGAVVFKNAFGPLLTVGGFVVLSFLADIFPKVHEWNPVQLVTRNMELLTLQHGDDLIVQAFIVNYLFIFIFVGLAVYLFKRSEI